MSKPSNGSQGEPLIFTAPLDAWCKHYNRLLLWVDGEPYMILNGIVRQLEEHVREIRRKK